MWSNGGYSQISHCVCAGLQPGIRAGTQSLNRSFFVCDVEKRLVHCWGGSISHLVPDCEILTKTHLNRKRRNVWSQDSLLCQEHEGVSQGLFCALRPVQQAFMTHSLGVDTDSQNRDNLWSKS